MEGIVESKPAQFLITVLAIMAGFILFKAGASCLPNSGPLAAVKRVVLAA